MGIDEGKNVWVQRSSLRQGGIAKGVVVVWGGDF